MCSITDILRRFKQNWTEELSPHAIAQACRDVGMKWYESVLTPVVTIQVFFVQILHGNTACEHLPHLTGVSFTAAAYCQARMRVDLEALHLLLQRCVAGLQQETFDAARWLGHRVFHVDGSSFSMPDTPQLQAHFGQQGEQKPGCGFPTAHWLVLLHAGTGMIAKMLASPLRTHDMSGVAELHPELRPATCWSRIAASVPTPIWPYYGSAGCLVFCESIHARLSISRRAERMCILLAGRPIASQASPARDGSSSSANTIRSSSGSSRATDHCG